MPTLSVGSKPASGFTLIEVLVVLVILALTMAVVVPAISKGRGGSIDEVTRDLAVTLRKARSDAVLSQRSSVVLLDVQGRRYWQERAGREGSIPERMEVKTSVATSEVSDGVAGIRFFPDGSSTGGTISLSMGQSTSRVLVDWLSGRVSIQQDGG